MIDHKKVVDEMESYVNAFMFPVAKAIEVGFDDEWTAVKVGDVTYQRSWLKNLQYRDGVFTALHIEVEDVPNKVAVAEFQALADKWKARGWDDFVEILTKRNHSDEYDSWSTNVVDDLTDYQTVETSIEGGDVQFIQYAYKPMTFNPTGLAIPYTNARITNLTVGGITSEDHS